MDTFQSLDGLWFQALGQVVREGRKVGKDVEVVGYAARLTDVRENWLWNPVRSARAVSAAAELLSLLGGGQQSSLEHYNGKSNSYHPATDTQRGLWRTYDQLRTAYQLLSARPTSRECVVVSCEPTNLGWALAGTRNDLPYTCKLQFLLRDRHLYCIADLSSNDVWWRMPYDVWCFSTVQKVLASALGVLPGWYQHQVGALHLGYQDFEQVNLVEEFAPEDSSCWRAEMDEIEGWGPMESAIAAACSVEQASREYPGMNVAWSSDQSLLNECAALVASHNKVKGPVWLNRNLLR